MGFKIILLITLVGLCSANLELFNDFKVKHNKNYASVEEQELRYQVFKSNLETIQEHNKNYDEGKVSWYMAVNQFTDLTPEEFRTTILGSVPENFSSSITDIHKNVVEIPASIDWRTYNYVTAVKDQGACGSCWTFSATGTLEGAYAKSRLVLVSFSEQELVDCATDAAGYNGAGCNGGVVQSALDYVRDHGIVYEESYPYEGRQASSCRQNGNNFKISGYNGIGRNDENGLKNAVGSAGPVSVALNANGLQSYGGGIYDDRGCSQSINHGVLAVGYGSENGQDYWIVKNSWGGGWGESGYVRMALGYNICAIASQACYPKL